MNMPCISICIPAYNAWEAISICLESIAVQAFDDYEVVIVDDGSDIPLELDGDRLERLGARRVRVTRQENGGTYAARRKAIGEACVGATSFAWTPTMRSRPRRL